MSRPSYVPTSAPTRRRGAPSYWPTKSPIPEPTVRPTPQPSYKPSLGSSDLAPLDKLTASDAAASDQFGYSVAIDGNTVLVGAYGKDSWTGAVYVLRTTDGGATYGQVAKLTASDAAASDNFGLSVAIDGNTVAIGAPGAGTGGAVYVLRTIDGGAT